MRLHLFSFFVLSWASIAYGQAWPYGPLVTSGSRMVNSQGNYVTYAGANWPGAADAMVPEGLQYASIATIVSGLKSLGMNVIRLTYAIEMIDDVLDNGGDKTLLEAFTTALGSTNGPKVVNEIIAKNPSFTSSTTRLEVYDAIAAECLAQEIYVHLDNHMSKGGWCCAANDGNAWFGDTYFNVVKWKRGLVYMANYGAKWGNMMSMGLRNELRTPSGSHGQEAVTWAVWYTEMMDAATQINNANPDPLLFLSGQNFDTDISPIPTGASLGSGIVFRKSDFTYANKLVLEIHIYSHSERSCSAIESGLETAGFDAMTSSETNVFPVVMTEFGYSMADDSYSSVYASCLRTYLPSKHAGWMIWVLAGSYYIRSGSQDVDETYGLYNHDFTAWRNTAAIAAIKTHVAATTSG